MNTQDLIKNKPLKDYNVQETVTIAADRYEWLIKVAVDYERLYEANKPNIELKSIGNMEMERDEAVDLKRKYEAMIDFIHLRIGNVGDIKFSPLPHGGYEVILTQ